MRRQHSRCVGRNDVFTRPKERNDSRGINSVHYVPAAIFNGLCAKIVSEIKAIVLRQARHGWRAHYVALVNSAPQPLAIQKT